MFSETMKEIVKNGTDTIKQFMRDNKNLPKEQLDMALKDPNSTLGLAIRNDIKKRQENVKIINEVVIERMIAETKLAVDYYAMLQQEALKQEQKEKEYHQYHSEEANKDADMPASTPTHELLTVLVYIMYQIAETLDKSADLIKKLEQYIQEQNIVIKITVDGVPKEVTVNLADLQENLEKNNNQPSGKTTDDFITEYLRAKIDTTKLIDPERLKTAASAIFESDAYANVKAARSTLQDLRTQHAELSGFQSSPGNEKAMTASLTSAQTSMASAYRIMQSHEEKSAKKDEQVAGYQQFKPKT